VDNPRKAVNDEDKLLIDQLTSEYRIIQDKIDKIGSFYFTVRGWSVTLVIASIFATGSNKTISPFLLFFLLFFVLLFYFIERKQSRLGSLLGKRALQIEKEVHRIIRSNSSQGKPRQDIGPTPWIAYHLRDSTHRSASSGGFLRIKRWARDPDLLFYPAQAIIIISTVVFLLLSRARDTGASVPPAVSLVAHQSLAAPSADPKGLVDPKTKNEHKETTQATR
jgi:hypothetical protein